MRTVAVGVVASLAVLAPLDAWGADLVLKAKPKPVAAAPLWAGFYFGGHVGAASSNKKFIDNFPVYDGELDASPRLKGGVGGFQLGYNYQINHLVFGVEGDFSWSTAKSNFSCFAFGDQVCSAESQWFATIAARAGAAFDRTFFYAKGGIAWVHDEYSDFATCAGTQRTSRAGISAACGDLFVGRQTRPGWMVGAGVEYAIAPNWSVKLEYNHLDFGKKSVDFSDEGRGFFTEEIHQRVDIVKVGFNYRFSQEAAGLAAYGAGGVNANRNDEKTNKVAYFAGVDASRQSAFGFAGALIAPYGDIDASGLRVMLLGGGGRYKYYSGDLGIRGTHTFGDILAGYAFEGDNYSINLLGGLSAANHTLSAIDPTNAVNGTELGAKIRADAHVNPTTRTLAAGEIEYSSVFRTFQTGGKLGYDVVGNGIFIGPEASYYTDIRSTQWRVGAHASELKLGAISADLSAGYSDDSILGRGAYTRLEFSLNY